jgi:hypothetical protein
MKIYVAATAPGNETPCGVGSVALPRRLLSYYFIRTNLMFTQDAFNHIKRKTKNENQQNRTSDSLGKS